MDSLPKLDRQEFRKLMLGEFEQTLTDVADAVDDAPKGRVIRDSEEPAREALDRLRKSFAIENQRGGSRFPPLRTVRRPASG